MRTREGSSAVRERKIERKKTLFFLLRGRFFFSSFSCSRFSSSLSLSLSHSHSLSLASFSPLFSTGNCGETDKLLRCSRCRTAWYCCRACQKVRPETSLLREGVFFSFRFLFQFLFSRRGKEKRRRPHLSLSPLSAPISSHTGPSTARTAGTTPSPTPSRSPSPSSPPGSGDTGSR